MDCRDNSCFFTKVKTGQRTNGGCRCLRKPGISYKVKDLINVAEGILECWRQSEETSQAEDSYWYDLKNALEALNE